MKQNDRKYEHGTISMGIDVELTYDKRTVKRGQEISVAVRKEARLRIDPKYLRSEDSHTGIFHQIVDFQQGANKLLREARKQLSAGQYIKFSITTQGYEDVEEYTHYTTYGSMRSTLNPLYFNAWSYSGDGMAEGDGADVSADGGMHLSPDTRYTNEMHDIWIPWGQDIFKVLEEAGI